MEQIISTLLQLDPELLSTYINYFFLVLAGVGLIGFLIGFLKGLYKESSTFIVTALYFVFLVFVNKWIANAIYSFDISSFVEVPNGGTTVGDYLNVLLVNLCDQYGITINNSQQMVEAIVGVSFALVNLVVYLVLLILGIVIIGIIDTLVYLIIVRLIVPKYIRKKKKRRFAGGLLGAVRYLVAFSLLLSPFSSIVNSTIGKLRDENGQIQRAELDNDYYNALMNVLEGYNNSMVAKMFFIVDSADGKSIDVKLMDYITESKINDNSSICIYDEIGNFGSLAVQALSTGFVDSTNSINLSLLLSAEFVGATLDTLAKSTLIQTLLSVGSTLVVNMDSVKQNVDLSSVDFMNVNWESSFTAVSSAYEELYNSGLIEDAINNPEEFINDFHLDSEYGKSIKQSFRELGDNDLICQIMPQLISSFIGNMLLKDSETNEVYKKLGSPDTYKDIKWGSELASIYEIMEDISKQHYAYENDHLTLAKLSSLGGDALLNILFGTGISFEKDTDVSYAQQYERNVFVNGGEYMNGSQVHEIRGTKNILGLNNDSTSGLMNLQIIQTMFEKEIFNGFIKILDFNTLFGDLGFDIDFNEKIGNVVGEWDDKDWKNEFSSIIDVVAPIMKLVDIIGGKDSTVNEVKKASENNETGLEDILSDDSLDCLKRITDVLSSSKIFDQILPGVLEAVTDKSEEELIAGLSLSDLNFTYFEGANNSMVKELRAFINKVDAINEDMVDLIEDLQGDSAISFLVEDCSKGSDSVFGNLLKIIESNQIFNKPLTEEEKANGMNKTFTNVMVGLLAKGEESDMNIYSLTDGNVIIEKDTIINFENNELGWENEIDGIVGFIGSLKGETEDDQVIFDYITGNTSDDFDLTEEIFACGDEIERIFASVDNSMILKEAFPATFDNLIGDSFEDVIGEKPNFYNVESWADEGYYFSQLLGSINSLKDNGQSLEDIDWLNVDETKLNNILTSLYKTQSVGGVYEENSRDNGIFHSLLKNIMSQAFESLDIQIEGEDVLEEDIIARDFDIDNNPQVLYGIIDDKEVYVSWLGEEGTSYKGEISNISHMVGLVSLLGEDDTIKDMEDLLLSINDCYILRSTLGLIIESKTESFGSNGDELMEEFINRSDFEVFHKEQLSLTPYVIENDELIELDSSSIITNREEEIEARKVELQSVVDILNDSDDLSNKISARLGDDSFDNIKEILENKTVTNDDAKEEKSQLEVVLTNLHNSKIFNTKKYDESNTRVLTAFEYFFKYILEDAAFEVDGKPLLVVPTEEDIVDITEDTTFASDGWINSNDQLGEISNFNNALYNVISNSLVDIKIHGGDFIKSAQESMAKKDSNGELILVDGDLVRDTTKNPIQDLLLDLYSSRILKKSNAYFLDQHIINYLLKTIGYGEERTNLEHSVERNVYQNIVLNYSTNELKDALLSVGLTEGDLNSDLLVSLWENEGSTMESLIFSIDSNLDKFEMKKFDSEFIHNITKPLENSVGLNYLEIEDDEYKNSYRSVYQLIVIKIVNTSIDAFDKTLGLYTDNVSNNLIEDYENEIEVAKDLVDAYKGMDEQGKFKDGNISFEKGSESSSTSNKKFMDLVVRVIEPLYRSDVYHNDEFINNRTQKVDGKDKQLSNLTIFEQVVYTMLDSSEDLTNELYHDDGGISYSETVANGKDVMNLRIREVSLLDKDPTSDLIWIELDSSQKVVYECEIGKVHDMAGEDLDGLLDPTNLDLRKIVKDVTVESEDKLLNIINASYVLHDIVPHIIARYVSTHDAEDSSSSSTIAVDDLIFLNDEKLYGGVRGYCGDHINSYLIEGYSDFFTKVEHWNNDLYYISQLTLLFDEIEENSTLSSDGTVSLSNVFAPLLYNLSMTETYSDALPQIVISVLNDEISVDLGGITPSLGAFIEGDENINKLATLYSEIDEEHSISNNIISYESSIWNHEGEGIDRFIKYIQSRDLDDVPLQEYALGHHMYLKFNSMLGL